MNLDCRCLGKDCDCECPDLADGEDGYCTNCRYPDGGCCQGRTWLEMDAQALRVMRARAEAMKQ